MSVLMKGMVVVIMLAVATTALACEQPTPQAAPSAASASAEDGVTPAKPDAAETLENTSKDPMVWIGERVPDFRGVFLDSSQNIVYIYLQDDSMQELAKAVLTDAFGPDLLEGREVRVLEGKYSMVHLDAWYKTLMGTEHRVPGITWTDLNEKTNRIEIGMRPLRGARAKMEAAIAASGVPREAVVINVGCVSSYLHSSGRAISADEAFMSAIDYS